LKSKYFKGIRNTCNLSINAALQPHENYPVSIFVEECTVDEAACENGVLELSKDEGGHPEEERSEYSYEDEDGDVVAEFDEDCCMEEDSS
jgi:hypothetical protein